MAINSIIDWTAQNGSAKTLVPMASRPDGITRRVLPGGIVGYPMVLATKVDVLPITSARKFKVQRVNISCSYARNDVVYGDFQDLVNLVLNIPMITVSGVTEVQRALDPLLAIEQYLRGSAFVGADVTGGKYSIGSLADLLSGQA